MNRPKIGVRAAVFLALFAIAGGAWWALQPAETGPVSAQVSDPQPAGIAGFARADGPRPLTFPADLGAHPDFQTEWWYYTGNLDAKDGRHFGFQLTIFRRALLPPGKVTPRASDWTADQVYLAQFALTDVNSNRFTSYERYERGGAGLAGAQVDPWLRVWLDDWTIAQTGANSFRLRAAQAGIGIDLTLNDLQGTVLEGDRGYSRKGPAPGNASYYFSQPRLATSGTVTVDGKATPATGLTWMDHEFSTSELPAGIAGWDWFALQLSDGSDLMVYRLRRQDGTADPYSSGMLIAADGSAHPLSLADFSIDAQATWTSAYSKAKYPSRWRIRVPSVGLSLEVTPWISDQEHHLSTVYWEGAVKFQGTAAGKPVSGNGYVELTGYAGSLGGRF